MSSLYPLKWLLSTSNSARAVWSFRELNNVTLHVMLCEHVRNYCTTFIRRIHERFSVRLKLQKCTPTYSMKERY